MSVLLQCTITSPGGLQLIQDIHVCVVYHIVFRCEHHDMDDHSLCYVHALQLVHNVYTVEPSRASGHHRGMKFWPL